MPLITLFTAPKPFTDPHINIIQRNALRNWQALGDAVDVVVVGNEPGIVKACTDLDVRHLPNVRCNEMGTPLISSIFDLARGASDSPFLMYSNADILFLPEMIEVVKSIAQKKERFLVVGQRQDVDIDEPLEFNEDWADRLREQVRSEGKLHGQTGSDYFIYPRACFPDIPNFAVGRAGWDNWMIFHARWEHLPVVNATQAMTVVHQNHDYAHLPGGIKHFFQPETADNIRKAGGNRSIFRLTDATHTLIEGQLRRKPVNWRVFWREVEIFPLVYLHSRALGWLSFALFHPRKALKEVRGWIRYKFKSSSDE